jgi:transcriptional regulator with PAS, ATPase and Fis domain
MNENIIKLIRRGSLKDAFNLIQKELDKYFDLSKADQRKNYLTLQKLKDNVSDKIWVAIKSKRPGYAKGDAQFFGIRPTEETITFTPRKNYTEELSIEEKFKRLKTLAKTNDPKFVETLQSLAYEVDQIDKPILIFGETGTGKSLTAKEIHNLSKRKGKPFEAINCANLTLNNIEVVLFGTEAGSYTDSKKDIKGKVKAAEGGTLFIDEINRSTPEVRGSLLDLIEYKKYERRGSGTQEANVRIILGTNVHPADMVAEDKMEKDFFHRIKTRMFEMPPLRKRKGDIMLFVDWYLENVKKEKYIKMTLDNEAANFISKYDWPGNLRELSGYLELLVDRSLRKNKTTITIDLILSNPPIQIPSSFNSEKSQLERLLLSLLEQWDPQNGKFISDFINPMIAKLYLDYYKPEKSRAEKQKMASKILGVDGSRVNDSLLLKLYLKSKSDTESIN